MSFNVEKLNSLPLTYKPNTLYCIRSDNSVKFFLSTNDGNSILAVTDETYLSKIYYALTEIDSPISLNDSLHTVLSKLQTMIIKKGIKVVTKEATYLNAFMYVEVVDAVDGNWTIDYSAAGFTKVLSVIPTALASGANLADRKVGCLGHVPRTVTSTTGKLMGATVTGLVVNTMVETSGKVEVVVIGI